MVQNIHIGLEDQNQNMNDNNVEQCHNFNIQSHNLPLLSCLETNIFFTLCISMVVILLLPVFIKIDKTEGHVMLFYVEVIMEYITMLIPLYILAKKESVRKYFLIEISRLFC